MEKTDNLNLNLPGTDDYYNVEDFNENFSAIDKEAGKVQEQLGGLEFGISDKGCLTVTYDDGTE